jgi:hypothetical protein
MESAIVRRYVSLKSAAAVLTILLCNHFFCPAGQAALKGGCAKVNITPPLGIPLIGSYGKPSDDILDELYASTSATLFFCVCKSLQIGIFA